MHGTRVSVTDRRLQDTYETRSQRIQQHIWRLQDEYEKLAADRPCIPDLAQHNNLQLNPLDAELRVSIDQIRSHITDYNRAVSEWDAVIDEYRLRGDRSSWAQLQLRHHAAFFEDPSFAPSLYFKFCELMHLYQDARHHLEQLLQQNQAGPANRPVTAPLAVTATSASASRTSSPAASALPLPATSHRSDRQHFYATAHPTSQFRMPTGSRSILPGPTHSPARTSFRGGRTIVNSAFHRYGSNRTIGIMTFTDGDIARPIPLAWQPLPHSATLHRLTPSPTVPPAPLAAGTGGTAARSASGAMDSTSPPLASGRPVRNPPTEEHRRMQRVLQHATAPPTTHEVAAGRGASLPTSGPLSVGADGRPFAASFSSGPLGSTASPADFGEDFSVENSSVFYRNATFNRAVPSSTAPSPLVLKDLPIISFEGDVRQYPRFRNRFLDVVEAHPNLAPRHKLQYLLQFLRGEPHRLANNFQITDSNYYAVVDLLEERYGNADVIRNLLMQNLVQIRPPSQSVADLRRFHDEAYRVTTELKQLGDNVDANRLYEQTLMAKLSPPLKIELIRHSDYAEKKTVTSILDGLRKYAQILELTASSGVAWSMPTGPAGPPGQNGPRRAPSPYRPQQRSGSRDRNPSYGTSNQRPRPGGFVADADTILVADIHPAPEVCTLCGLQHSSANCTTYTTVYMRQHRVKVLRLCPLCLREGHRTAPCPRSALDACPRCPDGQHHSTLCPKVEVRSPCSLAEIQRRRTVSPQQPTVASDASAEKDVRRPQDPDDPRYSRPASPAHREGASDAPAANGNVLPSAQMRQSPDRAPTVGPVNWKKIPGPTWTKESRTAPKGRQGTTLPTTTEVSESVRQQLPGASGSDGLLDRHQLRTVRHSPRTDILQKPGPSDDQERVRQTPYSPSGVLLDTEEVSVHTTRPSRPAPDCELTLEEPISVEVNRFDSTQAVQYRSASSSGGSDETEGLASTTTTTTEEDQPRTSPPSDAPIVILECTKTAVISPHDGHHRLVTLLFDSGSTASCVSSELVEELDLPQRDARKFQAHVFGSTVPITFDGATVTIDLLTEEETPLRLNIATTQRELPPVRMAPICKLKLALLRKEIITVSVTREIPDILIGQDLMHFFGRTSLPRLPHGFAVTDTILGRRLAEQDVSRQHLRRLQLTQDYPHPLWISWKDHQLPFHRHLCLPPRLHRFGTYGQSLILPLWQWKAETHRQDRSSNLPSWQQRT